MAFAFGPPLSIARPPTARVGGGVAGGVRPAGRLRRPAATSRRVGWAVGRGPRVLGGGRGDGSDVRRRQQQADGRRVAVTASGASSASPAPSGGGGLDVPLGSGVAAGAASAAAAADVHQGDNPETDRKYAGWRRRIFYSIFLGYACFYFTRNSFTYAAPGLRQSLGFSLEQLGVITSVFPLAYGFSKLVAGVLADKFSTRVFMALGLAMTGLINIAFGMQTNMLAFCGLWALNGVFQGFGAPPCAKLLTTWYSKTERGTWWGFWNTSHNTGGFLIPLLAGYCVRRWGWQYGMLVPGSIAIAMGLFLFNRLRDRPETVGLPPIEVFREDYPEGASPAEKEKATLAAASASGNGEAGGAAAATVEAPPSVSTKELLLKHVVSNPYVWLLAVSYFFVYFVRQGVSSWAHIYLLDFKGVANAQEAAFRVSGMEIGGLLGSLASGWTSDRVMRGRRIPVIIAWMLGVMASVAALWFVPVGWRYVNWLVVFCIGFFIYGPQMLVGLAGAEIVDRRAVSSTIGFLGWIAYLGASVAGYPLTRLVTFSGWGAYFASLLGCSVTAVLLLLPMWRLGMRPKGQANVADAKKTAVAPGAPATVAAVAAVTTGQPVPVEGAPALATLAGSGTFTECGLCAGTAMVIRLECGPATPTQALSCRYIETPCPNCAGKGFVPDSSAAVGAS